MIDMTGMFTVVKVRETLADGSHLGWYQNRPGIIPEPVSGD
jgi:hypothetical protein